MPDNANFKTNNPKEGFHIFEQACALVHIGVVITSLDANIVYINTTAATVAGFQPHELIGQNTRILKSGLQSPEVYQNLWNTISKGQTWHGEFSNKRKDGTIYWEEAFIAPILINSQPYYIAVKIDITELRTLTNKLVDLNKKADALSDSSLLGQPVEPHD